VVGGGMPSEWYVVWRFFSETVQRDETLGRLPVRIGWPFSFVVI
jgi:hypothetical protein